MNITQQYEQKAKELFELMEKNTLPEQVDGKIPYDVVITDNNTGVTQIYASKQDMHRLVWKILENNPDIAKSIAKQFQ